MAQHEPQRPSTGPARIRPRTFFERLHSMSVSTPGRNVMTGIVRGGGAS